MVVVAQLVRALDCGSRGRRFEPGLPPKRKRAPKWSPFFIQRSLESYSSTSALSTTGFWSLLATSKAV